jgi:hypothetical protein
MSTPQPPTENALQKERRLYNEISDRFINALLNRIFDLRPASAVRRTSYLFILFLLTGFVITLYSYPLPLWTQR